MHGEIERNGEMLYARSESSPVCAERGDSRCTDY